MEFSLKNIESDTILQQALEIYSSNSEYFYMFSKEAVSISTLKADINSYPPNTPKDLKNFKLVIINSRPVGIIDNILSYPKENSVFIGLMLVDKRLQGQGIGKQFIECFEALVKELGYLHIELGVVDDNTNAMRFWESLKFIEITEKSVQVGEKLMSKYQFLGKDYR